jgi:hypothetical protein
VASEAWCALSSTRCDPSRTAATPRRAAPKACALAWSVAAAAPSMRWLLVDSMVMAGVREWRNGSRDWHGACLPVSALGAASSVVLQAALA